MHVTITASHTKRSLLPLSHVQQPLDRPSFKLTLALLRSQLIFVTINAGRPKRSGFASKRIDANLVCTHSNKCLLVDEQNIRTALVHDDGLRLGVVKPNCVFQPQTREALWKVRDRWESYQKICGEPREPGVAMGSRSSSKNNRGSVLKKYSDEHIAKISVRVVRGSTVEAN